MAQFGVFYWARDARESSAEVDYLAVRQGKIYPVEVKSGTGSSLRSLHLMLKKYLNCPKGLVLYSGTYKNLPEQKITFLPLYCAATIGDRRPTVTVSPELPVIHRLRMQRGKNS